MDKQLQEKRCAKCGVIVKMSKEMRGVIERSAIQCPLLCMDCAKEVTNEHRPTRSPSKS